jgi:tRNA G18 (ribose-2'-O)-methylase SpoU
MEHRQLNHREVKNSSRKFPISVICENISTPENVGMIFRISEAMGVEEIIFTEESLLPPNRRISKVARSTDKIVPYQYSSSTLSVITQLRNANYKIAALEITDKSIELSQCSFQPTDKIALIIGSEKAGVNEETLLNIDLCIEIALFGQNTSINVVAALGISLYEITKQLR